MVSQNIDVSFELEVETLPFREHFGLLQWKLSCYLR